WIATRGSRSRSSAFTARGIDPIRSSSPANCTSVPLIRGDPSRRRVAMVRCLRVDNNRRTRAANFGSAASNSAHDAKCQQVMDTSEVPTKEVCPSQHEYPYADDADGEPGKRICGGPLRRLAATLRPA